MSFLDSSFELYHEIFGSVLDRIDLNPYLMRNSKGYADSLSRASLMMGNNALFPMVKNRLKSLFMMDYSDFDVKKR